MVGNMKVPCHDEVADADGLSEQLLQVVHHDESVLGRILGIEKPEADAVETEVEIVAQYAIVEQQLHIVFLLHHAAVLAWALYLDVEVFARFLLYQQTEVGGKQVEASGDAKAFADERGLKDGLVETELTSQCTDGVLDVLGLGVGVGDETVAVEVLTGAELYGFVAEMVADGLAHIVVSL